VFKENLCILPALSLSKCGLKNFVQLCANLRVTLCHQKNPPQSAFAKHPFHPRSNLNIKVTKDFICVPNEKPPRPSATPPKEEKTKKEIRLNPRLRSIRFIRAPKLKTHTFLLINSNHIILYKPNDIIHLNSM
jgi:hypothetical protein